MTCINVITGHSFHALIVIVYFLLLHVLVKYTFAVTGLWPKLQANALKYPQLVAEMFDSTAPSYPTSDLRLAIERAGRLA